MDDKKEDSGQKAQSSYTPYRPKQSPQCDQTSFGSSCKEAAKASFAEIVYSAIANIGRAVCWLAKIIAVLVILKILFIGW